MYAYTRGQSSAGTARMMPSARSLIVCRAGAVASRIAAVFCCDFVHEANRHISVHSNKAAPHRHLDPRAVLAGAPVALEPALISFHFICSPLQHLGIHRPRGEGHRPAVMFVLHTVEYWGLRSGLNKKAPDPAFGNGCKLCDGGFVRERTGQVRQKPQRMGKTLIAWIGFTPQNARKIGRRDVCARGGISFRKSG